MTTSHEPGYEKVKALILSPSQWSTFTACQRKWAWRYLAGIREPEKKGTAIGTRVHKQYEHYLNGEPFDYSTPEMRKAAEIAMPGIANLPPPLSPGMKVERPFNFETTSGILWRGVKDVSVPDSSVIPGCAGGVPGIIDHKSTKARRYIKTAESLVTDVQSVVYAYDTMAEYKVPVVDVVYNNVLTEGSPDTVRVHLRMYSQRVVDEFGKISQVGSEISVIYSKRPGPLDLPPNTSECRNFGGCSYVGLCTDLHAGPLGHLTQEEEANMTQSGDDLFTRLANNAAAEDKATSLPPGITDAPAGYIPLPFLIAPAAVPEVFAAINPPEGKLYVPAATTEESTSPVEKPKRVRRTKAQIEADEAAAVAQTNTELCDPPSPAMQHTFITYAGEELKEVIAAQEADVLKRTGFALFVNCIPDGDYTDASAIFAKAKEHVSHELQVADYRFAAYGKGQGAFVVAANHYLKELAPEALVLDTTTPEGALVCADFVARATFVVRGIR